MKVILSGENATLGPACTCECTCGNCACPIGGNTTTTFHNKTNSAHNMGYDTGLNIIGGGCGCACWCPPESQDTNFNGPMDMAISELAG